MIQSQAVLALMKTWIQKVREPERGLDKGNRNAWWITQRWYLKYVFQRGESHL